MSRRSVLLDGAHQLHYPPAFVPRDSLTDARHTFDALGDHLHTNMLDADHEMTLHGYHVQVLQTVILSF